MRQELRVQVSYAANEAEIKTWYKQVGDKVAEGDVLLEYETEKAAVEVPAPADGVLVEIKVPAGEKITRPNDASQTSDWSVVVGYIEVGVIDQKACAEELAKNDDGAIRIYLPKV